MGKFGTFAAGLITGVAVTWFMGSPKPATRPEVVVVKESTKTSLRKEPLADSPPLKPESFEQKKDSRAKPKGTTEANDLLARPSQKALRELKEKYNQAFLEKELVLARKYVRAMGEQDENSREYLESKTQLLTRTQNWEESIEIAKKCLEAFPKSKACLFGNMIGNQQAGTKEEHGNAIHLCLIKYPNHPNCLNSLALHYLNLGNHQRALDTFLLLKQKNGDYGFRFNEDHIEFHIGLVYFNMSEQEQARPHLDRACQLGLSAACNLLEQT